MATKRARADRDRVICAWIHGTASRHTESRDPQGPEREVAVAELQEAASSGHDGRTVRTDLLSQEAGLFAGLAAGEPDTEVGGWKRAQLLAMAGLCAEAAGDRLDQDLVDRWTTIGLDRAEQRRGTHRPW